MRKRVIILSGPTCAGKSSVAKEIAKVLGFGIVHTRELLPAKAGELSRVELHKLGEELDQSTGGGWIADEVVHRLDGDTVQGVVVDSARSRLQIDRIMDGRVNESLHVHLVSDSSTLRTRFVERGGVEAEFNEIYAYQISGTEALEASADILLDTVRNTLENVVRAIVVRSGWSPASTERLVDVVVGAQYGSEGKGQVVAYLSPEYGALVRVGGPNAGHKVFERPQPYTFHHLPSGSRRNRSAKIIIGAGAVVRPHTLLQEIQDCSLGPDRLTIDEQAMVIEDFDAENETKLVKSIGSTGQGVGLAAARRIVGRGVPDVKVRLARDVPELMPYVGSSFEVIQGLYNNHMKILVEGTQGTGLSLYHGTYPYVTSRDTTVSGVLSEAGIAPNRVRKVVLVLRTYPIRVQSPQDGTSGPMARELNWEDIAVRSGAPIERIKRTEFTSTTYKQRRVGEFDWQLLELACHLNGPTDIALTFVDYISKDNDTARRFEQLTHQTIRFIDEVEAFTQSPVSLICNGFDRFTVLDRRSWRNP